jgi:hypothetical protein
VLAQVVAEFDTGGADDALVENSWIELDDVADPCGTRSDLTQQRTVGVLSPRAGGQGQNQRVRAPVAYGR